MSHQARDYVTSRSPQRGASRLVLLAIADHAHPDGSSSWASVSTIAAETRLHDRTVQRILRRLEATGEIAAVGRSSRGTVVYAVVGVGVQQMPLLPPSVVSLEEFRGVASDASRGGVGATGGVASRPKQGGGGATLTRYEPPLNQDEPSRASARGSSVEIPTRIQTAKEILAERRRYLREHMAFGAEAEAAWLTEAGRVGCPYVAPGHLRQVHATAIDALRQATEAQVLSAIRRRITRESAPVRIPEWARLEVADADTAAHLERQRAEREDETRRREEDGARWAEELRSRHPGMTVREALRAEGLDPFRRGETA